MPDDTSVNPAAVAGPPAAAGPPKGAFGLFLGLQVRAPLGFSPAARAVGVSLHPFLDKRRSPDPSG